MFLPNMYADKVEQCWFCYLPTSVNMFGVYIMEFIECERVSFICFCENFGFMWREAVINLFLLLVYIGSDFFYLFLCFS